MIALLAAALLAAAPAAPAAPPSGRVLNRVAALVNGDVVTLRDLVDQAGPEWKAMEAMPAGPEREKVRAQVLRQAYEQVLFDRLVEAQAKELQVEITDAEIDVLIEDAKQRNKLDDAGLDRALQAEGLTRAKLRERYRHDLRTQRVIRAKYGSRIVPSDEEVKAYYQEHQREFAQGEEVHVRHVFLLLSADAPAADSSRVMGLADKVVARLKAGEDFAAVAKEVSQGPTAKDGGDLGWIKRGVVQREVETAAFTLETGKVSAPVRTRQGIHVLRVEERRGGEPRPFEEVAEEVRGRISMERFSGYHEQFVADARRDALIEVRLAELK
jgi:peptidyl-prolyl cis-trans isomerase SurA